jgi:membrane protein implicated in regulation of membrane protease activity
MQTKKMFNIIIIKIMEYYIWFIIGLGLCALEIATPGFVVLWFGVGAFCSGIAALCGLDNLVLQIVIFAVISVVLLLLSRTLFKNVFLKGSPGASLKTNSAAMVGKRGIVIDEINNAESRGRVMVESQNWSARSTNGEKIAKGTNVVVKKLEGVKMIVETEN